jgi:hypothetical protein
MVRRRDISGSSAGGIVLGADSVSIGFESGAAGGAAGAGAGGGAYAGADAGMASRGQTKHSGIFRQQVGYTPQQGEQYGDIAG